MTKTKDFRVYLDDIIESCTLIARYIRGKSQTAFENDRQLQDAVARRLEIIGEAIKRLPANTRTKNPEITWSKAIGMRNILAHDYDDVDYDQVWSTIKELLPAFKKQIKVLLDANP